MKDQKITIVSQKTKDEIKAKGYFKDKSKLNTVVLDSLKYDECVDCGKQDSTVRFREDGYGIQCYECYKADMITDEECR
jgi:Zn ribbon nucleic-acid-binding protein